MPRSRLAVLLGFLGRRSRYRSGGVQRHPAGRQRAQPGQRAEKSRPGGELYEQQCATCHGKRGEGMTAAPAVIGSGALQEYPRDKSLSTSPAMSNNAQQQAGDSTRPPGAPSRDPFRTAQDLFNYVSTQMPLPKSRAGTLKPDEYWAITASSCWLTAARCLKAA